jgi:hypothetical protein
LDAVRDRWKARWESSLELADLPGAVHADPEMIDWLGWTSSWDRIATELHKNLPPEIHRARRLERLVGEWRRATEHAFVFADPKRKSSARQFFDGVSREADRADGLPAEGTRWRRRIKLMRFVDHCARSGLAAWPDFKCLERIRIVVDEMDPEWVRLGRALYDELEDPDLRDLLSFSAKIENRSKLDGLVKAWGGKRAGAPRADAEDTGAYEQVRRVLKAIGDNDVSCRQLKKEWSKYKGPP